MKYIYKCVYVVYICIGKVWKEYTKLIFLRHGVCRWTEERIPLPAF